MQIFIFFSHFRLCTRHEAPGDRRTFIRSPDEINHGQNSDCGVLIYEWSDAGWIRFHRTWSEPCCFRQARPGGMRSKLCETIPYVQLQGPCELRDGPVTQTGSEMTRGTVFLLFFYLLIFLRPRISEHAVFLKQLGQELYIME